MKLLIKRVRKVLATNEILDLVIRKSHIFLCSFIYKVVFFKNQVEKEKYIFESFSGKSISDSPYYLYRYLMTIKPRAQFVWVVRDKNNFDSGLLCESSKVVQYKSKEYYHEYSTAAYWITNCRIPYALIKKRGQRYIQCWHGTPLKKMANDITTGCNTITGLKALKFAYKYEAKRLDCFLSPSGYATDCFVSSFCLDRGKIVEKGYPRNDALFNDKFDVEKILAIKSRLKIPLDKNVVLYAPTWRDNQFCTNSGSHVLTNLLESEDFIGEFDNTIFLYRGHYFTSLTTDHPGKFIDVSDYDLVNDILLVSDSLITDYSSIFFDFAILERPIYFFMPDLESYKNNVRGFYLELDEALPGPISQNISDLKYHMKTEKFHKEKIIEFNRVYSPNEDGQSSKRVIEYLGI